MANPNSFGDGSFGQGQGYYGGAGQAPYGSQPVQQGGFGAPAPGQPGYGFPPGQQNMRPPGQPGYAAPPGQVGYAQQPRQPGFGAPPGGQPGFGAPPGGQPGFGAPAGMDPQVYSWFQTVDADRSGKITASELQQALVNANWSHFNTETCRLMIGMFDRDLSGTIDVNEFNALWTYIQQWKGVFERYDQNRSGSIDSGELMRAFNEMGFRVSQQFANVVTYRFDVQARRCLTLDNFIQACVMLKSLTDAFRGRDTNMTGTINLNYEDFMIMTMLYKP